MEKPVDSSRRPGRHALLIMVGNALSRIANRQSNQLNRFLTDLGSTSWLSSLI